MSLTRFVGGEVLIVDPTAPTDPSDLSEEDDTVDKHRISDLIYAYEAGEDVDISGLPEPTRKELQAKRGAQVEARKAFDAAQAATAKEREQQLRTRFLAAGGSEADWQREKGALLAEDRKQRTLGQGGMFGGLLRHIT